MSISIHPFSFAYNPTVSRGTLSTMPAVAPVDPVSTATAATAAATQVPATPAVSPLTSAVSAAAQGLAPAAESSGTESSSGLDDALKSFTQVLAHSLRAALREGDDGGGDGDHHHHRAHGHGESGHHGRGHAWGHLFQAFQRQSSSPYGDLAPIADRLNALAARLDGTPTAVDPTAAVNPAVPSVDSAADAAVAALPIDPTVSLPAETPSDVAVVAPEAAPVASLGTTGFGDRLLVAFGSLQSALGLTPSASPEAQRSALASLLRAIADQFSAAPTQAGTTPTAANDNLSVQATGSLLQVTA